ncbi:hypothetical protein HPB50_012393 [Hyalomma asiaticum]|uniref:Uncharacterized protein n=1 Tax=Hyalomma asiaticum TaxID=266040 RepID=A0ACB7S0C7_HYAAI|nr:hypothetical protein HPB50_012393 [Hyalomma asiaticum]
MDDDDDSWADSVSSSSTTTSSAHCCVCNANNDSGQIAPGKRRRRSRWAEKSSGTTFPWTTCVPMVGLTTLAAVLLLFATTVAVRSPRQALQSPATLYSEGVSEKALPRATTTSTGGPLIQHEGLAEAPTGGHTVGHFLSDSLTKSVRRQVTLSPLMTEAKISTHHVRKDLTRKRRSKMTSPRAPSARGDEDDARGSNLVTRAFPFRRPTRPSCDAVYYTFCERAQRAPREYHYRRAANDCVDASNAADVCNRGANRFSSLDHCLQSCVSAEHPAEECFERPLFTRCARQDALSSWWHFEGDKCVPWTFPSGGCPANGSTVFTTARECRKHCLHRGARCRRPEVVACGRRHLKYPYFAHLYTQEGRVRCLRSSETLLQGHQCLSGANRFRSRQACYTSCRNHPPSHA